MFKCVLIIKFWGQFYYILFPPVKDNVPALNRILQLICKVSLTFILKRHTLCKVYFTYIATLTNASIMNATIKHSIRQLAIWTAAWLETTAIAVFGPTFIWEGNTALSALFITINLTVGAGMVFANIRHVLSLDEMLQKIQLQAMGLTLGVTLIAGIAYSIADITDVISQDAEISFLIILMGLTYLSVLAILNKKYS